MSGRFTSVVLVGAMCCAAVVHAQSSAGGEVLTNQAVVQMVGAKLDNDVILAKIQSTKNNFDLTTTGLVSLYTSKVPKEILKAMLNTDAAKRSGEVLTNQLVIQLVSAGLPRDIILQKIQLSKTNFDITSDGLVSLNANKVPKDLIKAMMAGGSH